MVMEGFSHILKTHIHLHHKYTEEFTILYSLYCLSLQIATWVCVVTSGCPTNNEAFNQKLSCPLPNPSPVRQIEQEVDWGQETLKTIQSIPLCVNIEFVSAKSWVQGWRKQNRTRLYKRFWKKKEYQVLCLQCFLLMSSLSTAPWRSFWWLECGWHIPSFGSPPHSGRPVDKHRT